MIEEPIGAGLNRNLGSPTAPAEAVERDLDRLIERRHETRVASEGERAEEEVWREAERREEARRQQEWKQARMEFCSHLEAVYTKLADEHGAEAARLRANQLNGNPNGNPKGAA